MTTPPRPLLFHDLGSPYAYLAVERAAFRDRLLYGDDHLDEAA